MTERVPRIGLVLGGGGIAGYVFHAAVLAAIEEQTGFDPRTAEIVVGTSAGAISGAILRGNVPTVMMRERLLDTARNPEEMETLRMLSGRAPRAVPRIWAGPGAPRMAVAEVRRGRRIQLSKLVAALLPQGRHSLAPVTEPLDMLHGRRWPQKRLWIPATDLETGRLVVFGRDQEPSVAEAVEASASLPVFFAPTEVAGKTYIDGGISSPFNADLLTHNSADAEFEQPLDLVIVLAPLSIDEMNSSLPFSSLARSLPRRRLRAELRMLQDSGSSTLVFQPDRAVARAMGLNPMDHRRVPSIISRSDELVNRLLPSMSAHALDILARGSRLLASPVDAEYPTVRGG